MWVRQFLADINCTKYIGSNKHIMFICENNRSSIDLTKNAQINERFKHIDIAVYYVREIVSRKKVQITHIMFAEMITDCLTKPFTANLFERLRDSLGMIKITA
jgi:hypothetical protein